MAAGMNEGRFEFLTKKLEALRDASSFRSLHPYDHDGVYLVEASDDVAAENCKQKRLLNFGSNDYLGLAQSHACSPDKLAALPDKLAALPAGAGASVLVSGYTSLHHRLCMMLAEWEQTQAAVIFPSGYAACSGTVATLAEAGDLLLSDQLNHASLIDGCRASYATRFVYPHADLRAVGELLRTQRHNHARAWIITDGVFGMDGDLAPLEGLCDLAEQYDAHVIVDEAHGTGVLGSDGSGSCAEMGVKSRVAIRIGTLSKAIGSHGGFVVGPQAVVDYLVNRCRSLIFSTAGSPLAISAAITAVESITREPHRRQHVRQLASQLRESMNDMGLTSETSKLTGVGQGVRISGVPIIPLVVGANERALSLASKLREAGFFVPAIRPPTVPAGTARLRISLTAAHQWEQIEQLLAAIAAG